MLRQLPWTWFWALVAVAVGAAAPAARLEVVVRVELAGRRVDAAEEEVARGRALGGHHPLGHRLGERAEEHADQLRLVSVLPPTDGPGKRTFTTRAGRGDRRRRPYVPALRGISVPLTWKNALHVADAVTP